MSNPERTKPPLRAVHAGACALLICALYATATAATESEFPWERTGTAGAPPAPEFTLGSDGSLALRICFNWACSRAEKLHFSSVEVASVVDQLRVCPGADIGARLQRLRVAIWQMELLAARHQPLLWNDQEINNRDAGIDGRTDCIDNTANTATFVAALRELGALPGWSLAAPSVRDRFIPARTHWTAVVIDDASGAEWSVDSWFRPHGHLPFVMPIDAWLDGRPGWVAPLAELNPLPETSSALCPPTTLAAADPAAEPPAHMGVSSPRSRVTVSTESAVESSVADEVGPTSTP